MSQVRSPTGAPWATKPEQEPVQIEPSTAPQEKAPGEEGMTQLAGSLAITMATKATTARVVIRIPLRTLRSVRAQHEGCVDHPWRAGVLDRSRVHPDPILLGQASQPAHYVVERRLLQTNTQPV